MFGCSQGLGTKNHLMDHLKPGATEAAFPAALREGFSVPWEGFKYMNRHPSLWRHGLIAVVLNLLITAFALLVLVFAAIAFISRVHPLFPAGWSWFLLEVLCGIAVLAVAVGLSVATWMLLQGMLCGYFYSQ